MAIDGITFGARAVSAADAVDQTTRFPWTTTAKYAGPDGFEGGLSTRKYEHLTGASRATSSRELLDLAAHGLLRQSGAGRGTRYDLAIDEWGLSAASPPAPPPRWR